MKQKWKPMQFVEISMHEIFCFQDKLDAIKDDPEKVWEVVDAFFMEIENELEMSPGFLKELHELDLKEDFVPLRIEDFDDLFDDEDFDVNYKVAQDYVNYVLYVKNQSNTEEQELSANSKDDEVFDDFNRAKKFKEDIPFVPRHDF